MFLFRDGASEMPGREPGAPRIATRSCGQASAACLGLVVGRRNLHAFLVDGVRPLSVAGGGGFEGRGGG
ncbi:hypothetical protein ADK94_10070, partial [Streptomyces sp. XY593]